MKKIVSLLLAGVMSVSLMTTAFADLRVGDTNPLVRIDNRELIFADQKPVIDADHGRTLVPIRGVFEAMGADVVWVADEAKVIIISPDNLKRVELWIGKTTMDVYTYVSLYATEKTEVQLDTAPVIYNGRTIMPLRAVCEAIEAKVGWIAEKATVDVYTKDYIKYMAEKNEEAGGNFDLKADVVNMTISANTEDVNEGDIVEILVNVTNTEKYAGMFFCGGLVTMKYNKDNFDYVGAELVSNGEVREDTDITENPDFQNDSVRVLFIVEGSPEDRGPLAADTGVYKLKFKAKNDNGGEFALTDRTNGKGLIDCAIMYDKIDDILMADTFDTMDIDTTPIVIK